MRVEIPKDEWSRKVFSISNEQDFRFIALEAFRFQYEQNEVYRRFCDLTRRTPETVHALEAIPFLPISFFKTHRVAAGSFKEECLFLSSGTTGTISSRHYVKSVALYEESFRRGFEQFYGPADSWCILGLLPSYLERGGSSLVYMVDRLIRLSGHAESGFYLHDTDRLAGTLARLEATGQKTLLIGVTYALLDFAAAHPQPLQHTVIMETGGMKGRKRELTREEVYRSLKEAFGLSSIHSEYGMTELLSQAYAADGRFRTPPWMRAVLRDETDPFSLIPEGKTASGALNIIDLANIYSCSFIATEDIGRRHEEGTFEVLGRMDNTDIRGCSLMTV